MPKMSLTKTMSVVVILVLAASCSGALVKYDCPRQNGLFADPSSCRKFYMCAENYPYLQRCPPSLFFDDVKKHCAHKSKDLVCGPVELEPEVNTPPDVERAQKCDPKECRLPDCFCSSDGTRIPGGLDPQDTPQMIILSFDGALHGRNYDQYMEILNETKKNPNGCPIKATFFIPHEYSSYFHIQKVAAKGHEIAINSISSRGPESYWEKASYENWTEEMVGMREILAKFGNLSRDSIQGTRAPFIKPGGNNMMSMLFDYNLAYDSSIPAPPSKVPVWPYTLDYRMPHKCMSNNCPTHSFPGVWEVPLNMMHIVDGSAGACALMDQCVFPPDTEEVFDFLYDNFQRHYTTNRAPMGLFFHINWFHDAHKVEALQEFMEEIRSKYKDVYFVTIQQALAWIRDPTVTSNLNTFNGWACEKQEPSCNIPTTCVLPFSQNNLEDLRYMQMCGECPLRYPWVGNFEGAMKGHSITELTKESIANDAVGDNLEN